MNYFTGAQLLIKLWTFAVADNHIALTLALPCNAERAWAEITNWEKQGSWMLQTSVWLTSEIETGPGTEIAAFTGPFHKFFPRFSFFGILDTMVVTKWQPPYICDVLHTGKIIKGTGRFEVIATTSTSSQFNWSEIIWAPRAIFMILKPALYVGVWISLRRFARTLR